MTDYLPGRHARAAAACAAVAVVAFLAPQAQAAPAKQLSLAGGRAASVVVDVKTATTLRPSELKISTRGTYAGLAIQDSKGRVVALSLNVRRWIKDRPSVAAQPITTTSVDSVTLRPGRYRLLLLTDGHSAVSVPATGGLARAFRPTGRYEDDVRISNITSPAPLSSSFASERVSVRPGGTVVVALHAETRLNQLNFSAVCLAQPGAVACNPAADFGGNNIRQNAGGEIKDDWTGLRFGITVPKGGSYDARIEDAAADIGERRDGLVIVL